MTGVIATIPRNQFFNDKGLPLASGKLYTYLAGTTTPVATYQDQALTTKNENPIPLDANGSCSIWLDPAKSYKFVLKDRGITQPGWPVDEISGASNLISLQPTLGLYTKLSALAAPDGAALVSCVQDGIGAVKRTVRDELSDTVSVRRFGAKGDGVADDTQAFLRAIAYCMKAYGTSFNSIDSVCSSTTNNWMTLRVPAGLYLISKTIRIPAPLNFIGESESATKIIAAAGFTVTSNNAILDFSRDDGHWVLSQKIAGFSVIDGTKKYVPIYGKFLHNYHIDDVAGVGGSCGFLLEGCYSGKIGRLGLYNNTVGGRIVGLYSPSTQEANDIHIERIEAYNNDTGLEVGGGLSIYLKGLIQKTQFQCIKVVDQLALLDISNLYIEDWYRSLTDYNQTAFAITTPAAGSGKVVGKLIVQKVVAVANKPVLELDQVLSVTITDNYWHNSSTCVHIAAGTSLTTPEFEYKRNFLKRSGSAEAPGTIPQEFYGPILRNDSTTVVPELYASDFITGNNAVDPSNTNFIHGFTGQMSAARVGRLNVDVMVPFALQYNANLESLKRITGHGPNTGFICSLPHSIMDANDVVIESLRFSSGNTQVNSLGDTAAACYVGGTFNTCQRLALRSVSFESTDAVGVNAVEFGRLLRRSTLDTCLLYTKAVNKGHFVSKDSTYINVCSNDDAAGTGSTNSQTQGNAFINTPCVGTAAAVAAVGTGNRVL